MGQNDNGQKYCVCRSSDTNRFMIGCDSCNEWYHGDCIDITAEFAKKILKFYCDYCRDRDHTLDIVFKESRERGNGRKRKQVATKASNKSHKPYDDDEEVIVKKETIKSTRRPQLRGRQISSAEPRRSHRRETTECDESAQQCYGPSCVKSARKGSKYCSDECGMKLAYNRIVEILPQRLSQWQRTGASADDFSAKELEAIRLEQQEARKCLEELDAKQKELEAMINHAKKLPAISEDEVDDNETDSELMIYCVTCGLEVASKTAMRHMERCFNKYESQTSFVSINKTKVEGVFCEAFNPQQRTYCMRLRVLCPEHTKEQKTPDDEVCGCPLTTNCFEYTGNYCRIAKKKCMKHYSWEKLRRAQLDMEKVQKWLKLEDLFEKEQKIRYTMSNRGSVLGLLLHQTIIEEHQ